MTKSNNTIQLKIKEKDFVKSYLKAINGILGLTDKELEVLTSFVEIFNELRLVSYPKVPLDIILKQTFDTASRLRVTKETKLTKGIDLYILKLKKKKVITKTKNDKFSYYVFNSIVIPKSDLITIKFIIQ